MFDCDDENDQSPYSPAHACPYTSASDLSNMLNQNSFSLVSMNVRSLLGKWNDVTSFLSDANASNGKLTVLAIQEIWNVPSSKYFSIENMK